MTIFSVLRLVAALAVFFIAGRALLIFTGRDNAFCPGFFVTYAVSFMLGLAAVALAEFVYSLLSIPFGFFLLALPWVAALIAGRVLLWRRPAQVRTAKESSGMLPRNYGALDWIFFAIAASQVVYALAYFSILPVSGYDAWAIWFFKAKVFYLDGNVSRKFLTDAAYSRSHLDYPLLVPLSISWIYTAMGGAFEAAAKIIYPLQFLSLLIIFNYGAARVADRRLALLFTALLSITPLILTHAAGFPVKVGILYSGDFVGYADLALSIYFLLAGVFLYFYVLEGKDGWLILSALFLGIGAWTKNEGIPFALIGCCLLAAETLLARRASIKAVVLAGALTLAFILPWTVYKYSLGLGLKGEYGANLNFGVLQGNIGRLGAISSYLGAYLFGNKGLFSCAWWVFFASVLLNLRGLVKRPLGFLYLLIAAQLLVYLVIYVITPSNLDWQITTSLERLLLHLLPLSMLVAVINMDGFLKRYFPKVTGS